jgi:S1-C subfamily serine protease
MRFASLCGLASLCLLSASTPARGQASNSKEPSSLQVLLAAEDVLSDAIARGEKSVVAIMRVRRAEGADIPAFQIPDFFNRPRGLPRPDSDLPDADFVPTEYGTGVVIDAKGLILTNYHVVRSDSQHYVTTHERKTYRAKIKAADSKSDLAVLELEPAPQQPIKLTPVKFGDASALRKGQIVIALGNPYGIARDGQVSASWGIISNLSRKAGVEPDESTPNGKRTLHHFGTLIQTDAKLNFGTSGGALLNLKGEMVGLTTSLAAAAGYEQAAGYAIPVNETFLRIVNALRQGREVEFGFLGVSMRNLDARDMAAGKQGMRVENVVVGTPAHRFGLERDDIITHVNGRAIYDSDGLVLNVSSLPTEAAARLTVVRNGQSRQIDVELAKAAPPKQIVTAAPELWRGMRVEFPSVLGPAFLDTNNSLLVEGTVVVAEVAPDSPAWRAGLRPEMIISHVGTTHVQTPKEFQSATAGKSGTVQLREVRQKDFQIERPTYSVTVE